MRRLWLLFSQTATVLLACWFIVLTLKPQWPAALLWNKTAVTKSSLLGAGADTPAAVGGQPLGFRTAARVASASVVSINASRAEDANPQANDPWFRFFFGDKGGQGGQGDQGDEQGNEPGNGGEAQRAMGSGVIVSEQGYILTNNHVIEDADEIEVVLNDGRKTQAKVIGTDPDSDLAVLQIHLDHLPVAHWAAADDLQVGDPVLAIGNPFGVGQTVTGGIVSGLRRNHLGINTFENFIQTDAAINPGNSGGALVDGAGNLLGINTAIYTRSGGSMGIGFAIPASLARQVLDAIVKEGHVTRGWIGVEPQDLSPELAQTFGLPVQVQGVLVAGVLQGGPAQKAGLLPGDVIVQVGSHAVRSTSDLLTQIAALKPGASVNLRINRKGQGLLKAVTPGIRPVHIEVDGKAVNK